MMIRTKLRYYFSFLLVCAGMISRQAQAQSINWDKSNAWVDSVYAALTVDQRIAQLMMVDFWPQRDSSHYKQVEALVRDYNVGGIIFFKGTPMRYATMANYYQSVAKTPLLIGIDGEWGLSMRVDSTPVFPRQMVLGATKNEELMYKVGLAIGAQCRRIGIHYNFAPDVDINNNPNNPVINDRSFGENKYWVAKLGAAYAKGLQEMRVISCAKHFPGHGDTETDSHYGLPVIKGDRKRLDSLELYPFKELIKKDVMSVMTAHLNVPALDTNHIPSSLSRMAIDGVLRKEYGFKGLIVTDALNMKGVADLYGPGEVAAQAIKAGNDIVLFVEDVPMAMICVKEYMANGLIDSIQVEQSCKRVLMAKYWAGLNAYKPVELKNLVEELNCCDAQLMIKKVAAKGIVVAKDSDDIIPVKNPELYNIACVSVGAPQFNMFQEMMLNYVKADYYSVDKNETLPNFDSVYKVLAPYNLLIVSLHNTSRFVSRKLGLTPLEIDFVNRLLQMDKKVILVNHGNPYILRSFTNVRNAIVAYEDIDLFNQLSAQVLFGAVPASGQMPVTVNDAFPLGCGQKTETLGRFAYVMPEEAGYSSDAFKIIDTIAQEAISKGATPGCQVLVAKEGKVLYQKSFGYHTYDNLTQVKNYNLYDVASLTKMLATTVAVMKLYDEHKIKLEEKLSTYLPELAKTNKDDMTVSDVMLHQAGLVAYIPIYKSTLINGHPNPLIYQTTGDSNYSIKVAPDLYMHKDYEQFVWQAIMDSEVKAPGEYVYSDLGFILLRKAIERITHTDFETYVKQAIYKPLNLSNITFNPYKNINNDWIVPTEYDTFFRWQLVNGTVHDQTAAMMGGVSGHAGLFASANDVAVIMQMLLNGGAYGEKRIIKEATVQLFTKKHGKGRRGYGFDKPETDPKKGTPTSRSASPLTFGHTGFTGTCAWADPKTKIVYVFLSNRVNPSSENKKLVDLNIRTRVMDAIYDAVGEE